MLLPQDAAAAAVASTDALAAATLDNARDATDGAHTARSSSTTARSSPRRASIAVPPLLKRNRSSGRLRHKNSDSGSNGSNYEEMMERFQLRRLQRRNSQASSTASSVHDPNGTAMDKAMETNAGDPTDEHAADTPMNATVPDGQVPSARVAPQADAYRVHMINDRRMSASRQPARFSLYWTLVRGRRLLLKALELLATPMSPISTTARVRHFVLLAVFLVNVIYFPLAVSFLRFNDYPWMDVIDVISENVFLVDFVLMFNTAFHDVNGVLVTSRRAIALKYLKTWMLLDLWSSIPIDSLSLVEIHDADRGTATDFVFDSFFRAIRFIHVIRFGRVLWISRVVRSGKGIWAWLLYSRYSHLVRISWIMSLTVLIAHYMACCWHHLVFNADNTMANASFFDVYMANYYDALQLLQGQSVPTTTVEQNVFASLAVLGGSVLLAIVFGHVAMLVSNFNANSTTYQRKMETLFATMSKMQLPAPSVNGFTCITSTCGASTSRWMEISSSFPRNYRIRSS